MTPGYRAACRSCGFERTVPEREQAEHAKHVHERESGHAVVLDEVSA